MGTNINFKNKLGITSGCSITLPSGPSLLLDLYPNAAAAYSVRRLSSTYTGNLIRVRRSSDNTEQNIGYDSTNVLDTVALLAFVGAGSGYITTWYDQSGNGNNATQPTALNQPQIVSAGSLLTVNSKPCMSLSLNSIGLILGSTISVGASSFNAFVGKKDGIGTMLRALTGQPTDSYKLMNNYDSRYYLYAKPGSYIFSNSIDTTTSQILLTGINSAGTMSMYKNGSVVATTLNSYNYPNTIGLIGYGASGFSFRLQEAVFYNVDNSSSRVGIETNINTYFTVYP